jgi:hypothetical protein
MREKTVGKKKKRAAQEKAPDQPPPNGKLKRKHYQAKLDQLHLELVKMQYWIKATGKKLVILVEGRDAAGKGGAIKCVAEPLNPRGCRTVALGKPSDTERTQWYFQRRRSIRGRKNPSRTAAQIVRGWINAHGPACESWKAPILNRLLQTLARVGFREITRNDLSCWRKAAWKSWLTYHHK